MMRKYVSRLLALVLVLCMVVLCVPVRARAAVSLTRPENITDEEWEILRQKLLAKLAAEQAEQAEGGETVTGETLSEMDTLSKSDSGNLTVTDKAKDSDGKDTNQTVSVELPPQADTIVTKTGSDGKQTITNEYNTTIEVEKPDGQTEEKDVAVKESYDLNAKVTDVKTEGDQVTDITYDIALNGSVSATDKENDSEVVKSDVTEKVDVEANKAVAEINEEATVAKKVTTPQYKVDMTVNGMKDDPTRVEHRYKETNDGVEKVEYYYNADNGIDETDTSKKYFTVSEVEKPSETPGVVEKVKEKVVSLWTNFLGIFHITNDAFEGTAKDSNGITKTYGSLSEFQNDTAADAAHKDVEMLRDYETGSTTTVNKDLTLDLNGHKYTNTGDNAAIAVSGDNKNVIVKDGSIISNGDGVAVSGTNQKFSLKNIFLRSNADENASGNTAALKVSGSGNTVSIDDDTYISGSNSTYGIQVAGSGKNTLNITDSDVEGKTGVSLKNADANISGSYVAGTTGAAVAVDGNPKDNDVIITSGWFESGKNAADISAKDKDDIASITVKGGRFTDPTGLYSYIPSGYAAISHNDGSYFLYEVVGTDYIPTRDGYRFLGYTDGNGNAITLAEAARKDVIAYAQWKEIPETAAKESPLIVVKTDEKGCTTKVTIKGDTAYVTVKDKDGEYAPISEVTVTSIKKLQNKGVDTIEVQVDEDVTLVLDIEKAKENGFTDTIEVNLEKDTLLITSGKKTCIELDIAVLKAADKPVEIQLVEGELTVLLGKNSSMSVDLTKALKTGERIVAKLENGVLKLYDKYNKPIKD